MDTIPGVAVSCNIGAEAELPETVSVIYNDHSQKQVPVIWNAEDIAAIDTENGGTFTVTGSLEYRSYRYGHGRPGQLCPESQF